jgi:thymidine kinase
MGKITLILGPMFSSKTTSLIAFAKKYHIAQKKIILIKYSKDNRYSIENEICSHDRESIKATFSLDNLSSVILDSTGADVVLIDEGQFFPDLASVCDELANLGKIVIVSALNGDFRREPFSQITELLPKCEEVHYRSAVCRRCFEDAYFTKRLTSSQDVEVIGGSEMYEPRCRKCFDL